MNTPGATDQEPDSKYPRLEQQIRWYDSKSGEAQRLYKRVKIAEFVVTAMVPVTALWNGWVTAALGVTAVILEGLQQLNQWHHNWITYRSTCEALRHEKYSYLGLSGSYDGLEDEQASKLLVERTESLISTEHAKWISRQEYEFKRMETKSNKDAKKRIGTTTTE
jgi:Protein of unknown function (DUF4231)